MLHEISPAKNAPKLSPMFLSLCFADPKKIPLNAGNPTKSHCNSAVKQKEGKRRGRRILPQNPSPKKGHFMVLCSVRRSHREICTPNWPLSETKFLHDFWGPLPLNEPVSNSPPNTRGQGGQCCASAVGRSVVTRN